MVKGSDPNGLFQSFLIESRKERDSFREAIRLHAKETDERFNAVHKEIKESVASLTKTIEKLAESNRSDIEHLTSYVEKKTQSDPDGWRKNWQVIIATVIPIAAAILFIIQGQISPLQTDLKHYKEQLFYHTQIDGHKNSMISIAESKNDLEQINRRIDFIERHINNKASDQWTKSDQREYNLQLEKRLERIEKGK